MSYYCHLCDIMFAFQYSNVQHGICQKDTFQRMGMDKIITSLKMGKRGYFFQTGTFLILVHSSCHSVESKGLNTSKYTDFDHPCWFKLFALFGSILHSFGTWLDWLQNPQYRLTGESMMSGRQRHIMEAVL